MPIEVTGGIVITSSGKAKEEEEEEEVVAEPRGMNKSNRNWKLVKTEKGRACILRPMQKTLGASWEKKQKIRLQNQENKEIQQALQDRRREQSEEARRNRVNKLKRKAENELKSSKIQVMSHPEKIKKMSKKQLKQVYKTRMGDDGVVRLVGAYQ
ncbi:hypothetical protein BASA81_006168 [Batrachochytrium salamandrivorans]|nr:hypothetical protein BASA81_006168 [Batrachochytrium salamandrivorans]